MTRNTKKDGAHAWTFTARFRRGAYGWKSSKLAVGRVREAVKEIRGVARRDALRGAEGAVRFLERVSPALEHVDSSSGAISNAVNRAIDELASIIADAPAEACRGPGTPDSGVDALCEEILLDAGRVEEAYARHGLWANRRNTYLATFRAVAKKYPHKKPGELLADLVETTPGEEGKWFATAKEAELYDEAIALARQSPCDPRTLSRAARDLAQERPPFALEAGLLALRWLAAGYGYEVTSVDVIEAYERTMGAAKRAGSAEAVRRRIDELLSDEATDDFLVRVHGARLGAS